MHLTPSYLLGLTSPNRWPYLFWSGCAGYLFMGIAYLRHHNCHVARCWRLGKHTVSGTPWVVCQRHHPQLPDKLRVEDLNE